MINPLILNLIVAHVLGDFYLQWDCMCKDKILRHFKSKYLYLHSLIIFVLSYFVVCCRCAWWLALIIALSHLVIDGIKSYLDNKCCISKIVLFLSDQILHFTVIIVVANLWFSVNGCWKQFAWVTDLCTNHPLWVKTGLAMMLALRPANILLVLILKACKVNVPSATLDPSNKGEVIGNGEGGNHNNEDEHGNFHSGALIGCVERALMLVFVIMSQYEALGFLVAAKSILRFSQVTEGEKSEYVLAGTLLSLAIALSLGVLVLKIDLAAFLM